MSHLSNLYYILQLERYEVARDTILSGLQIDPFRYIYVYCSFVLYWCLTECVVFKFGVSFWSHEAILSDPIFRNWRKWCLLRWVKPMERLSGLMTLIALFAWNCCTNLLQLHVGIHSADHASFSQWIAVGLYGWLLFIPGKFFFYYCFAY